MPTDIRLDEWLSEIKRLTFNKADGFSTEELSEKLDISLRNARDRIRLGVRRGLICHSGWRDGTSIDGRRSKTPVYRVIPKGKK